MKKYKIDNYIVKANSPIEAMKAVQTLKDSKIKDATKSINEIAEYFRVWGYPSRSELQEVVDFYKLSKNDMKRIFGTHYDETDLIKLKYHDSIKDAAFDRSTIEALIADEQAAIAAYNVAIANLKGKLSDEAIKVLQVIRDDEQNHVANLNAILSNNITEKNLEDSIKDAEYKAFYKGKELKRGDELVDFRGDKSYYYGCYHPRKITVSEDKAGNDLQEYYPSAFNVEIKA